MGRQAIGYKQPPTWTRFQKGKSGNPRGRPKKAKPEDQPKPVGSSLLDDALRAERNRPVKVNGSGGPQDLPMYDVVIRSLAARAAKGDVHAQKEIWRLWRELEHRDGVRRHEDEEREAKIFQCILDIKADQAKKWTKAGVADAEPVDPWPHPDDLIVDNETKKWRVRGPFDEEDVPIYEYLRGERDAIIAWLALKVRTTRSNNMWLFGLWLIYDMQLPKRWQNYDRAEVILFWLTLKPLRELRALNDDHAGNVKQLRSRFAISWDKESYRMANTAMKPLLDIYGYRSLAQFEKAYELNGDVLPMTRRKLEFGHNG